MKKPPSQPSEYEQKVINELNERRQVPKKINKFSKVLSSLSKPINRAGEWLTKMPGLDMAMEKTEGTLAAFAHNVTDWTVKQEETIKRYFEAGFSDVKTKEDIALLDLKVVEDAVGDLCKKYHTLAKEEEEDEVTALSLPGMPSDIIALVSMNHKAISEYATMYGFDITLYHERVFALNILEYAASTDEMTKKQVMRRLVEQTKKMVGKKKQEELDKSKFLKLFTKLTSSITFQLLKAKVGQAISIKGAVIGTGFNAYFTTEVCDVANTLYKQRFLAEKYGPEIINLEEEEEDEKDK
ncbi:EcsC family protein [Flammeovirgaceae bacterium SG7u.111]|nr:EcsC family protein [Flammeovirgaceae bacterium SG7u.132]WPO35421.1 EcsC family protein [Flammeovirgaceae bacterium SG7u.111]